jgi:hypothetical protein
MQSSLMLACIVALFSVPVRAQSQSEADRIAPQTRAGVIEQERMEKSQMLTPEKPTGIEAALRYIKDKKIVERLTAGSSGFRVHLGGLTTASGMAAGPEYYRSDLLNGQMRLRSSARASWRKFYLLDADLAFPQLAGGLVFVDFHGLRQSYPRVDYYGPGAGSKKSGRSDYQLEDLSLESRVGVRPASHFEVGGLGQYYRVNIGPGRDDRFASADGNFTEANTPGIQLQSYFLAGGGFVQYDWRDNPGGPRRGGSYSGQFLSYSDIRRSQFAFNRLNLEAQQYIPFFHQRRVIALRARLEATDPHNGQRVPFYLQPTLGGSDDLRGFRPYRFRDNDAIVLNAEYRWEVFSGLDMALFADAGRVFPEWRRITLRALDKSYGAGFRFNVRNNVFLRIDTGFSREGLQVWFKFGNVF